MMGTPRERGDTWLRSQAQDRPQVLRVQRAFREPARAACVGVGVRHSGSQPPCHFLTWQVTDNSLRFHFLLSIQKIHFKEGQ